MAFPHDSLFLNDNKVDLNTYPKKAAINKVLAPEWNALVRGVNAIANEAFVNGMALTNLAQGGATDGQALVFNAGTGDWEPGDVTPSSSREGWIAIVDIAVSGGAVWDKVFDDPAGTIIQSCTVSGLDLIVTVKSAYPNITVGGVDAALPLISNIYQGTVSVTIAGAGDLMAQLTTPEHNWGALDTVMIDYVAPPQILTLEFDGVYPGSQTECKEGDTFWINGTTDIPATAIELVTDDFNAAKYNLIVISGTAFSIECIAANRGSWLNGQPYLIMARACFTPGAYGNISSSSNSILLNNIYPTFTWGVKTYPVGQLAIKNSEVCRQELGWTSIDEHVFTSPTSELSFAWAPLSEGLDCTRIGGSYNVSINNIQWEGIRYANDAHSITQSIIAIANVAPTIDVTCPATRLRSGGNNGTVLQNHSITLTANQQLYEAPTMLGGAGGGTFIGSWVGGPSVYTRILTVHDDQIKGGYMFNGLSAKGLAGLIQNTINSGAAYTLGGFVARDLTFGSYSQVTALNVACVTYTKLQAGIFTASDHQALRNATQGNHSDIVDTYTVDALSTNPTTIFWNDVARAATNSQGTAKILVVEEVA